MPLKTSDKKIKQLVIERIRTFSPGRKISIGAEGEFSKEELVAHVKKGDKIGEKIIKVQMSFLQSLKSGIIFDEK